MSRAVQGFGFDPEIEAAHYRVEHIASADTVSIYGSLDGLCSTLHRDLWDAISPTVTDEFNRRLRAIGLPRGRWASKGSTLVARVLGKELLALAWAVEDEVRGKVPTAIANWLALLPEERWWLHTMAASSAGRRGWRTALRYGLCDGEDRAGWDVSASPAVPYAAVTPAARRAAATRRRAAELEAALDRADRAAVDARRELRAERIREREAIVTWLRDLAVEYRGEGLVPEDYALCEAAQAIEAGRHRESAP